MTGCVRAHAGIWIRLTRGDFEFFSLRGGDTLHRMGKIWRGGVDPRSTPPLVQGWGCAWGPKTINFTNFFGKNKDPAEGAHHLHDSYEIFRFCAQFSGHRVTVT